MSIADLIELWANVAVAHGEYVVASEQLEAARNARDSAGVMVHALRVSQLRVRVEEFHVRAEESLRGLGAAPDGCSPDAS